MNLDSNEENRESARVHNSTALVFSGETTQACNLNLPPKSSQIVEYTDGRWDFTNLVVHRRPTVLADTASTAAVW